MAKRIRGTTLQNIRKRWFYYHPLCVMCEANGKITIATELDHIKPLHQGGTNREDNYQSLCPDCHKMKSKQERGHAYNKKVRIGVDGFPV